MNKTTFTLLLACIGIFTLSFAQSDYTIRFQDEVLEVPENINTFNWGQMPESSRLANGYFGWIQFYETPSQTVQDRFEANSLQLMDYIPHRTYLFYFPETVSVDFLRNNGVRAIVPVEGRFKLSEELKNPPYPSYAKKGNKILVTLIHHKNVSTDFVLQDLAQQQITLEQQYKGSNIIDLAIPDNCLDALSNLPYVRWVELIAAPPVKDDTRGRSLHRASGLDTQTSAGRNYTGDGIGVMVRDDGIVGPHIDFQGRIDNSFASGTTGTHGDGVGGIMAGAGNLDPTMRGMAAGSNIFVSNYASNFLDTATQTYINNGDVQITNSSYSDGCNAGYTSGTRTVDFQTRTIPTLLHVFSAGNSNNNNCGYGAGNQWGNITGGHKQGKNVIATANTFFDGSLVNSSSRGPAHDGRIKPDIAANGQNQGSTNPNNGYQSFGGTSGAAPGIAGVAAQLYEVYGDLNGGAFPPSALIKATLLNTANEAGNIGPDYKFGWGIVNGLRAGKLIEEGRYLSDTSIQGSTNTHTINVPAGTSQVRFMVYWSDPEATPGANPALVNDLDLVVTDPSNNDYLPWILDPTPNPTTLNLPATNGEDHLNNVEQVLINSPAAGDYDIDITGFNVPVGPQEYFVVYEIISENLTLTYPNDGESFRPGETESIHWDGINTTAGYTLEYSTDNGGTWNSITTVSNTTTNYGWNVPNEVTGNALIRITSGSFQDTSDATFSIANQVTGLEFAQVCPTNITFAWNALADAEEYDVYLLGNKYMEVVGTTTGSTVTVPITDPNATQWAAIVAKNNTEGWESRRTIAINYAGGLLNCSLANDVALEAINNTANDFAIICSGNDEVTISATIRNTGVDPQSNFTVGYQIDSNTPVEETYTATLASGQQDNFEFTTPVTLSTAGEYTLSVYVDLSTDQNASNNEQSLDFYAAVEATSLDFEEDFETSSLPPAGWYILNNDGAITWTERTNITGSDGNATTTPYINNYNYNAPGEEDVLQTLIFDLTNTNGPSLTFDLAKAQYSSSLFDALRVEVSTDCGVTFTSVYEKTNLDLSTLSSYETSIWTPSSAADWRTETIDLSPYEGEVAMFRFVNVNGYGNSTFIDNINLNAGTLSVEDTVLTTINMYPNPAEDEVFIDFGTNTPNNYSIAVTNSLGQIMQVQNGNDISTGTARLNVANYASGIYFVTIKTGVQTETKKLVIK